MLCISQLCTWRLLWSGCYGGNDGRVGLRDAANGAFSGLDLCGGTRS